MAEKLDDMVFKSSISDSDVWIRPEVKPNGKEYYEYFLTYVDDILEISMDSYAGMNQLREKLKFKK